MAFDQYKNLDNAWLDPYGELFEVGFMEHEQWAREYLEEKEFFVDEDLLKDGIKNLCYRTLEKKTNCQYAHEYLTKNSWFRLLTWNGKDSQLVGYRWPTPIETLNADQESTLLEWCSANNYKFENLFKD